MSRANCYHGTLGLMAEYALFARDAGARIVGGCCGTTPEHVAAMVAALDNNPPRPFDRDEMVAALGLRGTDLTLTSRLVNRHVAAVAAAMIKSGRVTASLSLLRRPRRICILAALSLGHALRPWRPPRFCQPVRARLS